MSIVHNGPVGVVIPSLIPKVRRGLMLSKEVDGDFFVKGDVGGGVIQVVVNIVGSGGLMATKGVAAALRDIVAKVVCERRGCCELVGVEKR
jgi:hypothetical protein